MTKQDVAVIALRLSVAWVFLFAAWKNTESAAAWTWTKNETALLFSGFTADQAAKWAPIAALIGMIMMYAGGFSVLIGCEPAIGGLFIALFSLMGMRIHALRRDEAKKAGEGGDAMGWSAFSAHTAAGLKNWAFVGGGMYFALLGTGKYSVGPDVIGGWIR